MILGDSRHIVCTQSATDASRSGVIRRGPAASTDPASTRAARRATTTCARLGGDQATGGQVPPAQARLVVGVEPAAGDRAQVDGGGARPGGCRGRAAAGRRARRPGAAAARGRRRSRCRPGRWPGRSRSRARRSARRRGRPAAPGGGEDLAVRRVDHDAGDHARRRPRPRSTRPARGGRRGSWSCRRAGRRPSATPLVPARAAPSSPRMPSSGRAASRASTIRPRRRGPSR